MEALDKHGVLHIMRSSSFMIQPSFIMIYSQTNGSLKYVGLPRIMMEFGQIYGMARLMITHEIRRVLSKQILLLGSLRM